MRTYKDYEKYDKQIENSHHITVSTNSIIIMHL